MCFQLDLAMTHGSVCVSVCPSVCVCVCVWFWEQNVRWRHFFFPSQSGIKGWQRNGNESQWSGFLQHVNLHVFLTKKCFHIFCIRPFSAHEPFNILQTEKKKKKRLQINHVSSGHIWSVDVRLLLPSTGQFLKIEFNLMSLYGRSIVWLKSSFRLQRQDGELLVTAEMTCAAFFFCSQLSVYWTGEQRRGGLVVPLTFVCGGDAQICF